MRYDKQSLVTEVAMHNPPIVEAHQKYHDRLIANGKIDEELYEIIKVVGSQVSECEYCATSHRENLNKQPDMDQETVTDIYN